MNNFFQKLIRIYLFLIQKRESKNINTHEINNLVPEINFSEEYWENKLKNIIFDHQNPNEAQIMLEAALGQYPNNLKFLDYLDHITEITGIPVIVPEKIINLREKNKDKNPFVSITICTFNHEKFIKECLESVLNQSYNAVEIIIGDDNSSDNTVEIIQSVIDKYYGPKKIKLIINKFNLGNDGGGNWRNVYRQTRGEFIIQFCGDDVMHSNMVEKMVEEWQSNDSMLVTINARMIDENSNYLNKNRISDKEEINNSIESLARDGVNHTVFGAGTGYDRRLFEIFPQTKSNPTYLLYTQDIVYPFFAYLTGGCSVLSEPLMSYRIHGTQNSYSIAYDKEKNEKQKLILEEKSWVCHLAHALYMKNILSKLVTISHVKYVEIEKYLSPLLDHQVYLMSSRLILVRKKLLDVYKIREIQN